MTKEIINRLGWTLFILTLCIGFTIHEVERKVSAQSSFPQFFSASGIPLNNMKCIADTTTSNTSGAYSVTLPNVGMTTVKGYNVQALSPAGVTVSTGTATISSVSTASISGSVYVPALSVLGLLPIGASGTATPVSYFVCGV